jgi:hypothetical protein
MNIKEIDAMTLQQAVEYSLNKIVKQGKRCMSGENCTYADREGNHCAIGWLLDHGNVEAMHYGAGLMHLIDNYPEVAPQIVKDNFYFFSRLQEFHDAQYEDERIQLRGELESLGIDTSHPNFQVWIELGE